MILLDTCIVMYAAGKPHEHREKCQKMLKRVAVQEQLAGVDVETLQELLHRYRAAGLWQAGSSIYGLVRRTVRTIFPITSETTDAAHDLMNEYPELGARDALHAAVVFEFHLEAVCSYDTDFDQINGLRRIEPA